jgi:hypothetical protein
MTEVDLFTHHRALTNSKGFASFEDPEGFCRWWPFFGGETMKKKRVKSRI